MVLDRFDHLVGEFIALDIDDGIIGAVFADFTADCVEQMRLAQPGRPIDKKRVIGIGRVGGDRERRCVCKFIGGADNKRIEGEIVFPTDCEAIRIDRWGRFHGCWRGLVAGDFYIDHKPKYLFKRIF